jgi:hypothetical protein
MEELTRSLSLPVLTSSLKSIPEPEFFSNDFPYITVYNPGELQKEIMASKVHADIAEAGTSH